GGGVGLDRALVRSDRLIELTGHLEAAALLPELLGPAARVVLVHFARWHATRWAGPSARSTGGSTRQRASAMGQRGWNRHPGGIDRGLGGSPDRTGGRQVAVGSGGGTDAWSTCAYGWRGRSKSVSVGASSTIWPRYMTATRSATWRTTPRS